MKLFHHSKHNGDEFVYNENIHQRKRKADCHKVHAGEQYVVYNDSIAERYRTINQIGEGSFACIYVAEEIESLPTRAGLLDCVVPKSFAVAKPNTPQKLVVKVPKQNSRSDEILKEWEVLENCIGSDFIVTARFLSNKSTHGLCLWMDYYEGGDLYDLVNECDISLMGSTLIIAELVLALEFLHSRNIIHGDIKPENIGLDYFGHIRLLDFGVATQLREIHRNPITGRLEAITESGTLPYAAPEVLMRRHHGTETDWWSVGVMLYELIFYKLPFMSDTEDPQETCKIICTQHFPTPPEATLYQDAYILISQLLNKAPEHRLSYSHDTGVQSIMKQEFFKQLDWEAVRNKQYKAKSFF
mmetsp:Transcript_39146/g.63349  ORF Transcript_39146/g.63349 Transcript_39146/m.63349 type:complete len:357 (-) Transcript_39146:684-1754(-)